MFAIPPRDAGGDGEKFVVRGKSEPRLEHGVAFFDKDTIGAADHDFADGFDIQQKLDRPKTEKQAQHLFADSVADQRQFECLANQARNGLIGLLKPVVQFNKVICGAVGGHRQAQFRRQFLAQFDRASALFVVQLGVGQFDIAARAAHQTSRDKRAAERLGAIAIDCRDHAGLACNIKLQVDQPVKLGSQQHFALCFVAVEQIASPVFEVQQSLVHHQFNVGQFRVCQNIANRRIWQQELKHVVAQPKFVAALQIGFCVLGNILAPNACACRRKWDHLPEDAFMYVGSIEQAAAQAEAMAAKK